MAQERKKTRIVLASILKPVDDTRMYEKMGVSLAKEGHEVHIIGYPSKSATPNSDINFHPIKPFARLSFMRVVSKWKVLSIAVKLQPDVFIFTTHELLGPALWLKVLLPVKVVYDVRENYYRNILHSGSFPLVFRLPLAVLVRWKEKLLAPAIDHFFLAERGYETEFRFFRSSWTVLENKTAVRVIEGRRAFSGQIRLLFSGTLAESTGVFSAITLAKELFRMDPSITLTIVGHAALKNVQEKILKEVELHSFIRLVGGASLVPHHDIVKAIQNSDYGIIAYPPSPHTINSLPTKLFEYLGAGLPIILDRRWPWIERYKAYDPFVLTDFEKFDYPKLLAELKAGKQFKPPPDVTWESEEPKLLDVVAKLK